MSQASRRRKLLFSERRGEMLKRKYVFAAIYAVVLAVFTTYVVLDTFVIEDKKQIISNDDYYNSLYSDEEPVEVIDENNTNSENKARGGKLERKGGTSKGGGRNKGSKSGETPEIDNSGALNVNTYKDDNISITVTQYTEYDTSIYVADVKISSMKYLKTAFADNSYGKNITAKTSEIAKNKNAVLAINGDYYGARNSGYVIRNGILYRENGQSGQEALMIKADGSFEIIDEGEVSAKELLENGAAHVFSFGPGIVENGKISVTSADEVGKAKTSNPRTAIGIIDNLHYVFVVSDGRTGESAGLTLYQLAEFMQKLGVNSAYNLDGGGSSTMYFNGNVVNNPTTSGDSIKERSVSDIVYIGN